jgi:hypothetical protein
MESVRRRLARKSQLFRKVPCKRGRLIGHDEQLG